MINFIAVSLFGSGLHRQAEDSSLFVCSELKKAVPNVQQTSVLRVYLQSNSHPSPYEYI